MSGILIIDDHAVFRADARALLEAAGYTVVGEAEDARSGIAAAAALRPDVVLLDVQLPDSDGFTVAEQLAVTEERPTVVLISSREAADYGARLRTTPAAGFIHKADLSRARLAALLG